MENKDIDISLDGAPNIRYEKFFEKFKEIETLDVGSWNTTHLLGYFCKKYQETYSTKYKFKFNSTAPSKCFEVFQVKRLSNLLTSQPKLLKEYVDWIFINKITKAKKRITSISFLTKEEFVFEYRDTVLLAGQKGENLDRSKVLPDNYKAIFNKSGTPITTYGDLAFLSQLSEQAPEVITAFNELEALGFDKNILNKII